MITGYTVGDLQVGDIVRVWIGEKPHWGVIIVDKYPDDNNVIVSIVTTTYCYTRNKVPIGPEQFPPVLRDSMCNLEFKPLSRQKMLQGWVGRLEDRSYVEVIINAWFSEINKMKAQQKKQLKALKPN